MNNIIKRVWNQNRLVNIEDLTGMVFQAEIGGHTFEISGIDDTGAAVALSGTVSGVFRRPDNADIALIGSASDGVVSVTLSEDCYAVPGRFGMTIFVTSNSQKVAVYACVGTVAVSSTGNVAGDTPASVEDLIDDINAAIADLNSAIGQIPASYANVMAAIAPTYSGSALYSVGSYAWHNGSLYRCTTPITTAEAWTAAHWTQVALAADVADLKSAKNNYEHYIIGADDLAGNITTTDGYYIPDGGTISEMSGFDYTSLIPVEVGKTYTLFITNGTTTNPLRVHGYNSSGTWVELIKKESIGPYKDEPSSMIKAVIFTVPTGIASIRFSTKNDKKYVALIYEPTIEARIGTTNKKIETIRGSLQTNANIFDKTDTENVWSGYFRSYVTGQLVSNSDFTSILIPVLAGETYICTGTSYKTSFLDSNLAIVTTSADSDGVDKFAFTVPDRVSYVSLNFRHAIYPVASYMVTQGSALPDVYMPYGAAILNNNVYTKSGLNVASKIDGGGEVYTVGTGKDFTTFTACMLALANDESPKTIYIDAGTYDLYDELGGDDYAATVNTSTWADWNVVIPPNTKIIGIGNVTFNFLLTSSNTTAQTVLSPLNIIGSVHLENITINAQNCRYAVHDDGSSRANCDGSTHVYKNMIINKLDGAGYMQACGFGIGASTVFEFDNCIINGRRGLTFHNNQNKYNGIISIKDSVLIGHESRGLDLNSSSDGDNTHSIVVNCMSSYISQGIKLQLESGFSDGKNPYKLTVAKCGDVTIDTSAYASGNLNFTPVKYQ